MLRRCWTGLLLACLLPAQETPADWVRTLISRRDEADPKLVEKLANTGTREAAQGLVEAYDGMHTVYFRREIARALGLFANSDAAVQTAMTKAAQIAGNSTEDEVRAAAIASLARSATVGKQMLQQLVDKSKSDKVREPALRAHVAMAAAGDADWYRHLWNVKNEQRKDAGGNILGQELSSIRQLAVQGMVPHMSEGEFVESLRIEYDSKIRRQLLQGMIDRKMPKAVEMSEWMLERVDMTGADRMLAARALVKQQGAKAANRFFDLAKKRDVTPEDLRNEMAALIAALRDDATDKRVLKLIGKGKPHEQVFALRAAVNIDDPKLVNQIRKGLADKEAEVRAACAQALALRGAKEAVPDLRKLLQKPPTPQDQAVAIDALGRILQGDAAWTAELVALAEGADRDARNAALEQIAATRDKAHLPVLFRALEHADWSTRLLAVSALGELRDEQVVPKLIERLDKDKGRLGKIIGDVLWKLTAQSFEGDVAKWRAWWNDHRADFKVVSEEELAKAETEREQRRLRQTTVTPATFFGIQIVSTRVIFVIDVSGSMLESMYGHYVEDRGAARIDVAKQQLIECIKALDAAALFNIYAFNSGVARWLEAGISDSSAQNRQAAITWVERLGASGATNLYDSLKLAFADLDVDTIYVMSDGEPTNGEVIDPHSIRRDVAEWNRHRKVQINTVAIGGNLEVLEWLAADSGGRYLRIR